MSDTALIVMARYPVPGATKTRLARTLGDEATLQLYRSFLVDIAGHFSGADYHLHWAYTPATVDYAAFLAKLLPGPTFRHNARCFAQRGADLNARLLHAFRWTRHKGYTSTILIGSDTPHITREHIIQAQRALAEADVVLGPADDGGYYLIAMREPHDVFTGITMSTDVVAEQTITRAAALGLTVRLLDPLFDIDEYTDLVRLAALLRTDRTRAPATVAQITRLRRMHDHDITEHACSPTGRFIAALDLP